MTIQRSSPNDEQAIKTFIQNSIKPTKVMLNILRLRNGDYIHRQNQD